MSKKKKIIICSVFLVVLLGGIITGIILANIRRYSMRYQDQFDFNNHTKMEKIEYSHLDYLTGDFYNNGVKTIHTIDNKYGLYSYIEDRVIVEPTLSSIQNISHNLDSKKSYFKFSNGQANNLTVVDEKGNSVGHITYDATAQKTYSRVKLRDIDYSSNNNDVKAKINNRFKDEIVEIKDVTDVTTHYYSGLYFYEVWEIKTADNLIYKNLYKITDKGHELIQTLNNETGIELDQTGLEVTFLTNGTPVFMGYKDQSFNGSLNYLEAKIYDINFNLKGFSKINIELIPYQTASFRLGNCILSQYKIPTNDNKYDLFETDAFGETKYYRVETYKLSLNNGSFNRITFDYLINDEYSNFNLETVLINASKIEDKKVNGSANYLINERLQFKEINYEFNNIIKINDNRYISLIQTEDNKGNKVQHSFNLIDKNYNLVAHFENCASMFATDDSIIATDNGHYYICNTDGVILKKYSVNNLTLFHDDQYYLKKVEKVVNDETIYEYYLEQLGYAQETPLYTYSSKNGYAYKGERCVSVRQTNEDQVSLITTVKLESDNTYTYTIYTLDGTLLNSVTGQTNSSYAPELYHYDDDHAIVYLNDVYFVLDR